MNTNALRQKILDLAIHGKLVKQDPSDESATILLEKIRAEKEKKIASGELKRGKNDSYIFFGDDNRHYEKFADGRVKDIEDEIPFVVPEGWAWCRLGEIYYHTTGKALKKSNEKGSLKKYITTSNLYWDTFDFSKVRSMYFTDEELDKCTIKKGDLVVCNGGDVGRAAIWNYDHDICYQNHVSRMRPKINGVENRFFLYVLMFYKEQNLLSGKGIGISSLSASDLLSAIVPLPPTNQQRLIVSEIQKIFTQINLLEQNKVDLQTAVKQAKSKILDLAIRGKLVPQDPADEPARVMLEKLRAEKEAKIVAGEIKRGKNDSYIYKNSTDNCYYEKFEGAEEQIEIPFDLPEGWCWQKISSICEINPKNKLDNTLEISFVPMTLIDSEFNNNFTYELQRWETVKSGFSHFADNDIGIAKITPCFENRKSVIFKNLKNKYGAG
ncbi:restriction endonuclease subunit S, partial [Treponema denticola]